MTQNCRNASYTCVLILEPFLFLKLRFQLYLSLGHSLLALVINRSLHVFSEDFVCFVFFAEVMMCKYRPFTVPLGSSLSN